AKRLSSTLATHLAAFVAPSGITIGAESALGPKCKLLASRPVGSGDFRTVQRFRGARHDPGQFLALSGRTIKRQPLFGSTALRGHSPASFWDRRSDAVVGPADCRGAMADAARDD